MAKTVLKVKGISKSYKKDLFGKEKIVAVDNVSFHLEEGEIYGLIGPNGAGKSTIIKIITGLARADSGSVEICGHDLEDERVEAIANLGAIIEIPEMDKNMTAKQNLLYLAQLQGGVSVEDVEEAIRFTQLEDRINEKFSNYSLGMKQRIGLAQAIMHSPKILILDEPTNGMDPQWIISTRQLLLKLAKERGIAIMISSHILGEMQLLCDRIGAIVNGKIVLETKKEDLKNLHLNKGQLEILFSTNDNERAARLIKEKFNIDSVILNGEIKVSMPDGIEPATINRELVLDGLFVNSFKIKENSLEDLFNEAVSLEEKK